MYVNLVFSARSPNYKHRFDQTYENYKKTIMQTRVFIKSNGLQTWWSIDEMYVALDLNHQIKKLVVNCY
jgi:hypothetical protein